MSGHGTNPIFLNKKIKVGRPKHLLTRPATQPLRWITSHFYITPSQSGCHMCITPFTNLLLKTIKIQNSEGQEFMSLKDRYT